MAHFSRWKIFGIVAAIILGIIVAAPNLMSRDFLAKLPAWVPTRQS